MELYRYCIDNEIMTLTDLLTNWLHKIDNGEIERSYKSEPIPDYETEPGEPQVVVAKNLISKAFDPDR